MSLAPFDPRCIAQRLREQLPALRMVGTAADYAAVKGLRDFVPRSAYVLMAAEEPAGAQPARAARRQPVSAEFGVVLSVSNYRAGGPAGDPHDDELATMVAAVRGALLGWQPPMPGHEPIVWRGGAVLDYDDQTILWADGYEARYVMAQ
jgi:hypothetical protein